MEFITIDMFLSLAGCILIVALVTEALKKYFTKINALWLNLICSIIVGILRIIVINDFSFNAILTGILNIFVIMLSAGGSYDTAKKIFKGE